MASNANAGGSLPPPMRARLTRELSRLQNDPPPGIAAYAPNAADPSHLRAQIDGPPGTPFSGGIYLVSLRFTNRYPFEPPRVRFVTPVHHPNIDSAGRICLDTLKSPPAGSWSPAVSLPSLLTTLRALLSDPNPDDALVPEIADMYKVDVKRFEEEARRVTQKEATAERVAALEAEMDGGNRTAKKGKKAGNADAAPVSAKMEEEKEKKKKADDDQKQQSMKESAATEPNPAEESEDNAADHGKKRSADGEKEEGRGGKRQRLDPGSENVVAATAAATAEGVGTSSAAASAATATSPLEQ